MCCLNVWPSASLQLYIVAHCDKQLHAPALDQSISLKFSLETRLESESFEPLIDFLAYLGQKL